jgi:hypothetical protein
MIEAAKDKKFSRITILKRFSVMSNSQEMHEDAPLILHRRASRLTALIDTR